VIGETLAHYRILERLGSGGMGDVYRAEDLRLRRFVAIKTLRDNGIRHESVQRLLAEARAASTLTHPNIAVIYDAGEAEHDGRPIGFIAMELVEGTTVAALIAQGPIDLDRVLDIVSPIADALTEAHAQGLVHRDIKPSNVMVTSAGRVKLLDFGVAQCRTGHFAAPDDITHTAELPDEAAGFVGTLPYVAPEQATGREVDGRADMFSLGVMLYELVCGTRPFNGQNAAQMLEAILRDEVPPMPDVQRDPRLPQIERLVRRMLARDPERRLPSLRDVRDALGAIRAGERLPATIDLTADAKRVAVAAFVNISGNPEDDWLGTGISETLTADIAQLEGMLVIPRERLSELIKTISQQSGESGERNETLYLRAGRELRARWVVLGGFQRSGDALRVTASLMDIASGQLVRTIKVDGGLNAIFALQDQLVRELAGALRAAVTPESRPSPETALVDAYEAFSRGVLNRSVETIESLDRAVWLFERAVTLDPAYARAHVELGAAYSTKADYLGMPELHTRALSALRRAIELQPESARAWRELGATLVSMGQETEGITALRRALAMDPQDASVYGVMGRALFIGLAQFRDAVGWFESALERNAKAGWYALQLAHCSALLRDFPRGERAAQRAMELQEAFLSGREGLFIAGSYIRAGHLAALQGRHADALEFYQREIDFLMRTEHALRNRILVELNARLGSVHLRLGDERKAQAAFDVALDSFERRVRLGADDPFTRYYAASVHALRGDVEPALAFLERALSQQRAFTAARARIEPEFESLRADPRFQRLVGSSS
jgi:serine/threonine protein kinase/tetratricopeptide (TPR) repeat protein